MAARKKRTKTKWDSDVEQKIIDIWDNILEEFNGKMITRKIKETIATTLRCIKDRCRGIAQ